MTPRALHLEWMRHYAEGTATPEIARQLESVLRDDPEFRALFVEYLNVDLALSSSAVLNPPAIVPVFSWRKLSVRFLPIAAAIALILGSTWLFPRAQVRLQRSVGAEFVSSFSSRELIGQSAELKAGLIELNFNQAEAVVVIEAPARFRIEDAKTLRLESGRVTAHVRDGRQGLRVLTPHTDVHDLGTRFAVEVREGQRSEVHVFDGKVETSAPGEASAPRDLLAANQARRFVAERGPEERDVRSGTFVQPEEMKALVAGMKAGQVGRALDAEASLKKDAALVGWVGFETQSGEAQMELGGAVIGARRVQGRFPGQQALEFVDRDDHARLDFNAVARELTLLTWVRLDRVPEGISSIYHTDNWNTPGQVHWMVLNNGQMRFAVFGSRVSDAPQRGEWPESREPLLGELGRWVHLAAVYEADRRQVSFYANGRLDSVVATTESLPAVLGPGQIGNWNRKPMGNASTRRFSGRMDEFIVLSRALNADEINHHFEAGTPYR